MENEFLSLSYSTFYIQHGLSTLFYHHYIDSQSIIKDVQWLHRCTNTIIICCPILLNKCLWRNQSEQNKLVHAFFNNPSYTKHFFSLTNTPVLKSFLFSRNFTHDKCDSYFNIYFVKLTL